MSGWHTTSIINTNDWGQAVTGWKSASILKPSGWGKVDPPPHEEKWYPVRPRTPGR